MSVVPDAGIVRKHYEEARRGNIEYKPSAFWQVWLQRAFASDPDIYSVTGESSPDGSRRRVDIVVKRYDPAHDTLSAMLWVECKSPKGSVRDAEAQALDAAVRCIEADNLLWIYVMTTVGVSFRAWFVERDKNELIPLHGTASFADRTQYIDADSEYAWILGRTVEFVKDQIPLGHAPVLPSQPLPPMPDEYAGTGYGGRSLQETGEGSSIPLPPAPPLGKDTWGDYDQEGGRDRDQESLPPSMLQDTGREPATSMPSMPTEGHAEGGHDSTEGFGAQVKEEGGLDGMDEDTYYGDQVKESAPMPRGTNTQSSETWVEVEVTVTTHKFSRDEYVFTDSKGRPKITDRNHWERAKYGREKVWAWHGKVVTYFTRQKSTEHRSFSLT